MPRHHHHHHDDNHHRTRHDVYDDTPHNRPVDPANEVTVHRHAQPDHHAQQLQQYPHPAEYPPFGDMQSMFRDAEREMHRAFAPFGPLFGPMRGPIASMDRMFDDVRAPAAPAGSYYYEARTMTVGPDGRVREETVRTAPDHHGVPRTSRTVRDGDRVQEMPPYRGSARRHPTPRGDDVVVEEVDENGHPIHPNPVHQGRVATRRASRDDREHRQHRDHRDHRERHRDPREHHRNPRDHTTGGWIRSKYHDWRNRA